MCRPVHFNIRPGKKYLFYVKKVSAGRYVSVAIPDPLNRKSRKASKKLLCPNCGKQLCLKNDNEYIFVNYDPDYFFIRIYYAYIIAWLLNSNILAAIKTNIKFSPESKHY